MSSKPLSSSSKAILNWHLVESTSKSSSNLLISSIILTRFIFPCSPGLVRKTCCTKSYGGIPITTIGFPSRSSLGSPSLSRRMNSYCFQTGICCSPFSQIDKLGRLPIINSLDCMSFLWFRSSRVFVLVRSNCWLWRVEMLLLNVLVMFSRYRILPDSRFRAI